MTQIEISQDETAEIIPSDQTNRSYLVSVEGASIRIGHTNQYARNGAEIKPGDRVRLDNLRGQGLYAYAEGGNSTVHIDEAGVNVEYMTRASTASISEVDTIHKVESSDVSDRAAREIGKARMQDSSGVLIDPATSTDVSSEQPRSVSELSNTSTIVTQAIDPTNSFTAADIPNGTSAVIKAASANVDPAYVGSFELNPGEEVSIRATDLSDISVSGSADDEIQALIPGGS